MPALTQQVAIARDNQLEEQDRQRQTIEKLAYALWKDRGCLEGTADNDWLEAEQKFTERVLQASGR